jgi:hypothetical protein
MKKILVYSILIAISAMSCCVYHPHMVDIPLISKKGDVRLNAGISMVKWHATVSAGISKWIALQTYGSTNGEKEYYVQQSVGYFKALENRKVMEIYTGFGYGYGDAYNDANPGDLFGNYQVYFTQFNFGKINCDFAHADFGFGLKTGLIHSKLTDRGYYERVYPPLEHPPVYTDNSIFIEPQIFVRLGGEHLKVNLQVGATGVRKLTNKDKYLPTLPVNIGLGINYSF